MIPFLPLLAFPLPPILSYFLSTFLLRVLWLLLGLPPTPAANKCRNVAARIFPSPVMRASAASEYIRKGRKTRFANHIIGVGEDTHTHLPLTPSLFYFLGKNRDLRNSE